MKPPRVFRFEIPDRVTLERLAAAPLPAIVEGRPDMDFTREIYFDTPAADLKQKGATVQVRLHKDGTALLRLEVLERHAENGKVHRRYAEAEVEAIESPDLLSGASEPARLLRTLIDPGRLAIVLELETLRRLRRARLAGADELQLAIDLVTVRAGGVAGELFELELTVPEPVAEQVDDFIRALQDQFRLKAVLADVAARARELLARRDVSSLQRQLHDAREVAVIAHDRGSIALFQDGDSLRVPSAPGTGAKSCRGVLRRAFGHARARIRLLGVRADVPGHPALEVWLAENLAPSELEHALTWIPIPRALEQAGAPGMRDPRTLAALHVVARSNYTSWVGMPPGWSGQAGLPSPSGGGEPFEPFGLVIRRLEVEDTAGIDDELLDREAPPQLLLNPDLSRLAFNERILAFAEDPGVPLLERLRFLGIAGERLDDFFMSRVAHFKRLLSTGEKERTIDGLTAAEQLDAVAIRANRITTRAYRLLDEQLLPALEGRGIHIERWHSLAAEDREFVRRTYGHRIEALVTPLVADPSHPFPHIRNLRPALAAIVRMPESRAEQFLAIELPGDLPRFVPLVGAGRFVSLEDVIEASLPELYHGLELSRAFLFRVTRSATMDLDTEPLDMLQAVEEEVTRRPYQEVVRLECERAMPPGMRHHLLSEFQYEMEEQLSTPGEQDVYAVGRLVDLASLEEIAALDLPHLKFLPGQRRAPLHHDRSVLEQVRHRDLLFHFPHDDFEKTVERFLHEVAADPDVVSIKITLYRTSKDSAVVAALRSARARGKEVTVVVELKASFEEQDNIAWARGLEQDGIRVVLSPAHFKVHAKIALVVRREGDALQRVAYIGTGNLNAATARSYVDFGLLTADPDLTREVGKVFNLLTGYAGGGEFSRLLVAPFDMRKRFLQLIHREIAHARAGRPAGIRLHVNGLSDRRFIGALYRASQAGVHIDMMVREICALRPGLKDVSETIRVVSVVGRLLQHARIFHFRNGGEDEYFIGSADWRPRNLHERVEVVASIRQADHKAQLDNFLTDTLSAPSVWQLQPNGEYVRNAETVVRETVTATARS